MRQMLQCRAMFRRLRVGDRVTPRHLPKNEIGTTTCSQRSGIATHPPGVVHGHGKADGFPDGFRPAERASGPPSGSTGNALAGRPSGQQLSHTLGFAWKTLRYAPAFPTPPLDKMISSSICLKNGKTVTAALRWPRLAGTQAGKTRAALLSCGSNPKYSLNQGQFCLDQGVHITGCGKVPLRGQAPHWRDGPG